MTITEEHEPLNYQIAPIEAGAAPDLLEVSRVPQFSRKESKGWDCKKIPVALLVKIKFLDKIKNVHKVLYRIGSLQREDL